MAKWERQQIPPLHCRNPKNPSFSSSLLDAIYRSIDDSDSRTPSLPFSSTAKIQLPDAGFKYKPSHQTHPPTHRRPRDSTDDRRHRRFFSATSSADCSSFGGFSSSHAGPIARPRAVLNRSDRIRSEPTPTPEKKSSTGSIRSRFRDLRKSPTSASPRSRLTAFLNAIFSAAGGSPKKTKLSGSMEGPVSLSVSSYSRTGTNKVAVSSKCFRKMEPVRFSPVNVIAAENRRPARPCGGEDLAAAWDRWRAVEMRDFEKMEEDARESVSSSELFELESLTVIGRLADELQKYDTSTLGKNRAISRSFIL